MESLSVPELEDLARRALIRAGAAPHAAGSVAAALVRAEADGNRVCGVYYLPIFCAHLASGKVDGRAIPGLAHGRPAALSVDAGNGFAHPAFDIGIPPLNAAAREYGIAALAIRRSYNALALGDPVERIAEAGLIGLGFANAPASVAPPGASRALFGTNPIAFAVPGQNGPLLLVDQSTSAVAKTEIALRRAAGRPLEPGWAQDSVGAPTIDPEAALAGAIRPNGGQKGGHISLLVELLAAIVTGASLSIAASSLSGSDGGPPNLGQFFIAIDPAAFSPADTAGRLSALANLIDGEPGMRRPGARRLANRQRAAREGLPLDPDLLARIRILAVQ